jgi:hypothetical protein
MILHDRAGPAPEPAVKSLRIEAMTAGKEVYFKHKRFVFTRAARSRHLPSHATLGATVTSAKEAAGNRMRFSTPDRQVIVKNEGARYPGGAAWPLQMRADMVAAILDFSTTKELCYAIALGQAPFPTAFRSKGKKWEAVWATESVHDFVSGRCP